MHLAKVIHVALVECNTKIESIKELLFAIQAAFCRDVIIFIGISLTYNSLYEKQYFKL